MKNPRHSRFSSHISLGCMFCTVVLSHAAPVSWTAGTAGDASGAWNGLFNGQTYSAGDDLTINGTAAKTVTLSGAIVTPLSLTVSNTAATTLTGSSVGGTLSKTNAGALTLSSANTFGDVTISGGKFNMGNAGGLGTTGTINVNAGAASGPTGSYSAGSAAFFYDAATLGSSHTLSKNIAFGTVASNTTYGMAMQLGTSAAPLTTTLSGNVTGASNVTLWLDVSATSSPSFSTWILSGDNSGFAGNIRLNRGNIQFNTLNSLGTGALFLQTNGSDGFTQVSGVTPPSNLTFGFSGTVANPVTLRAGSGSAVSIDTGAGNVTLSNSLTLSGGTFNKNGAGTLAITGTLDTLLRANGTVSATAPITPGALTSGNANANLRAGTLDVSAMTGSTLTFNVLDGAAGSTLALGAKALSVAGGTFSGTLSGTGATLIKTGTGDLTLSGNNTFTGGSTLTGGTIRVSTNNTALGGGSLTVTSAAVNTDVTATLATASGGGARTLANDIAIINNGTGTTTLGADGGYSALTLNGVISGNGRLQGISTGTVILGGNNTYSGTTTTSASGTLRLANVNALGSTASGTTVASGGTLDLNGQAVGAESISLNGNGVGSSGSLVNSSATVASLAGNVSLVTNSSLGGSGDITISGAISGANTSALTKVGPGKLTLSNSNTYSGVTTVAAGMLDVTGSLTNSAVTVNNNANLRNSGALNAGVTIDLGGALSGNNGSFVGAVAINGNHQPGAAGIGLQTFSGGLTYGSASQLGVEFIGDSLGLRGTDYDGVDVTGGNLSISPTSMLALSASATDYSNSIWDADRSFTIIDFGGAGTSTGIFSLDLTGAGSYGSEGEWSLSNAGGDMILNWAAVPEPASALLGSFGLLFLLRRRRSGV